MPTSRQTHLRTTGSLSDIDASLGGTTRGWAPSAGPRHGVGVDREHNVPDDRLVVLLVVDHQHMASLARASLPLRGAEAEPSQQDARLLELARRSQTVTADHASGVPSTPPGDAVR